MRRLARILMIVFVAAFAAGTASHVAAATKMSLSMAAVDHAAMPDCRDCPDGQDAACAQACMASLAAICPPAGAVMTGTRTISPTVPERAVDGETGPPDPHPPRASLPS